MLNFAKIHLRANRTFLARSCLLFAAISCMAGVSHAQQPAASSPESGAQGQQTTSDERMRKIWPNLPPNQNAAAVARGRSLFQSNCSFCHGPDASGGNGGPDLIRSVLVNHDEHGNLIGPTIHNGRPGKGMPSFNKFTDAQVKDLVAFLHQQNRDDRIRSSYKISHVAVGNASAGKTYFQSHCTQCHSAGGDLAGIAANLNSATLQQLWMDPAANMTSASKVPPYIVTVVLPSGQKLTGRLQHIDEFDVAFYDANGYHSFAIGPGLTIQVHDPFTAHEQLLHELTDTNMHDVTTYLETLK